MKEEEPLDALRGLEFFQQMADDHLQRLANISRLVEFQAQSLIFHEDDLGSDVFFIVDGNVSLINCASDVGCRTLAEVGRGELIGWSPLVGRPRLSDTAKTTTPTTTIAIRGDQLLAMCREQPQFGFEFMHRAAQVIGERLGATRIQLLEMSGHRLPKVILESD